MKIVHVSFDYDASVDSARHLLSKHYTVTGWAEALTRAGAAVTVIGRFREDAAFEENGVRYILVHDKYGPLLRSWQLPTMLLSKVISSGADIIHLHHLSRWLQHVLLRLRLPAATALVVQHHGGVMPPRWRRKIYAAGNHIVDGFFFTTLSQGREWLLDRHANRVFPVMEGATFFDFGSRDANRRILIQGDRKPLRATFGIAGDPVFLWVGRLDENKDPLTILDAFEAIAAGNPLARLYMIFHGGNLLAAVRRRIDYSTVLSAQVRLLGEVQRNEIEPYYICADYFLLGSHYEGSGYALSEALRCGCIPIVTNIAPFAMMTSDGNIGTNFTPGDPHSLTAAIKKAMTLPLEETRSACIRHYESHLSFDAIASRAITLYQEMIDRRRTSH